MTDYYKPINQHRAMDRYRFLTILNAAHKCEEYQFAKQATMLWLVNYPGDLYVKYFQAKTFEKSGKVKQGKLLYETLIEADPYFVEPVKAVSELSNLKDLKNQYLSIFNYLTKSKSPDLSKNTWKAKLWLARKNHELNDNEKALELIHESIIKKPPTPLPAILHLNIVNKLQNQEMLYNLSDIYYEAYPKCLQINIIKALTEIERGMESAAVERLHWVEANDNSGQVITRLLGTNHRFKDLWPDMLEAYFDLPIPASVSSFLGMNQLNPGTMNIPEFKQNPIIQAAPQAKSISNTQEIRLAYNQKSENPIKEIDQVKKKHRSRAENKSKSKDYQEIQTAFSKIAKRVKIKNLDRTDNRFPVYVILSSKKQLETIYGPNTTKVIDNLLQDLVGNIRNMPDWDGKVFYPDDAAQMTRMGLKPIIAKDAWQVKLALADLDTYLEQKGEMIGALLIVGGPEIVPYHRLPNPTNDNDLDVPSDNPYGTINENYFIPQWPVGRLPGDSGPDAGILLSQIRSIIYQYEKKLKSSKSPSIKVGSIFTWILNLLSIFNNKPNTDNSLGYSAEIWKDASTEVYKSAAREKELQLSPPMHTGNLKLNNSQGHEIGYFNLHGIKDGPNWYGQKDFASESTGPDYPIALSPNMFDSKNQSPKLVFTEACYGANIIEKNHNDAISLKFLDTGTNSFVGSTCIAYGSVMPPLIAADFLAESFWKQVLSGQSAGYALMQAKLKLAEEMTKKQGFLDGEDQKTILSFILFGDPLAVHDGVKTMPKPIFREKSESKIRTISDSDLEPDEDNNELPGLVSQQVKSIVKSYLPGLQNAQMKMNKSYNGNGKHIAGKSNDPSRYVVTLQKSIDLSQNIAHHHYARMTFNEKGKLVKFTTSR